MPLLKFPVLSKIVHRFGNDHVHGAVMEMNGWRDHMEDAHAVVLRDNCAFVGIFDGHAGGSCARYLKTHLPEIGLKCAFGQGDIIQECQELDDAFLRLGKSSGSTATFAILHYQNKELEIANVGDSRTMLIRDGRIAFSTMDHKVDVPSEAHRVTCAGGDIDLNLEAVRSKNQTHILRMTRSFGDRDFKNAPTGSYVTPEPDVKAMQPMHTDYLLVTCDGVLEGLRPEEIANIVAHEMERTRDPALTLNALLDAALHGDSSDNLTAVLLAFGPKPENFAAHPPVEFIPGPLHSNTSSFIDAWAFMAARGGHSVDQAVALRAHHVNADLQATQTGLPVHRIVAREKKLLRMLLSDHSGDMGDPAFTTTAMELSKVLLRKMHPSRLVALEKVQQAHLHHESHPPHYARKHIVHHDHASEHHEDAKDHHEGHHHPDNESIKALGKHHHVIDEGQFASTAIPIHLETRTK